MSIRLDRLGFLPTAAGLLAGGLMLRLAHWLQHLDDAHDIELPEETP